MKLTDIFTGRTKTEDTARSFKTTEMSSRIPSVNQQIRSMVPGQMLQGEIVARNGAEVQIKLTEDFILNARIDQNLNLETGKNMTFEVKNNGSALILSPLFENVSTDVNVLKALDMAGISVNHTSVAMTEQMMEAGLSVSRSSIQQLYREVNAFSADAEIMDIVQLHKLGLPVNQDTVTQMVSYRNLNHQLLQGMDTVLEGVSDVLEQLTAQGKLPEAGKLYQELLGLVQENLSEDTALQQPLPEETVREAGEAGSVENVVQTETPVQTADASQQSQEASPFPLQLRTQLAEELRQTVEALQLPQQQTEELLQKVNQLLQGDRNQQQFFDFTEQLLKTAMQTEGERGTAAGKLLLSQKGLRTFLTDTLKNQWLLKPQEVADPKKVEEVYNRLNRQLKGLTETLENVGQNTSGAYKAAGNLTQNIDFLQQINQMYAYVQLPLRLQQGMAQGELYVYTTKKHLASQDGKVSALLHLDMEHLGPVDVYVALQDQKVSTRFFVQEEEMLDFLEGHMDLLTQRLKQRGYDCTFSMETRKDAGEGSAHTGLAPILEQEKGMVLTQYAFDVRT